MAGALYLVEQWSYIKGFTVHRLEIYENRKDAEWLVSKLANNTKHTLKKTLLERNIGTKSFSSTRSQGPWFFNKQKGNYEKM